jgi:hypothetical protein
MIRALLRLIGLLILAIAFVALVRDGATTISGSAVVMTPLDKDWYNINDKSLALLRPAIERQVAPWLWTSVIQRIIEQPTWLVLGIPACLLILLGRKKKPLIGYGRD